MSGRGGGRSYYRGRGGRGYGRGRSSGRGHFNKKKQSGQESPRKGLSDYIYKIGAAKQASDFTVITKYLINHIRKTYKFGDDIGKALEEKTPFVAPEPSLRRATDATLTEDEKVIKNRGYELRYKYEIEAMVDRQQEYESNVGRAYAFLFGQCNKAMQHKLQARTDYESTVKGNPIELLRAIEEHSISYQENKYEMRIVFDALRNFVNLKQAEDESLIDYTARFKSARDIVKAQVGNRVAPIILTKYLEAQDDWAGATTDEKEEMAKEAYKAFTTFVYIENTDRSKYGSLVTGLSSQFALNNDQYPKDMEKATNVLSNHRFDQTYHDNRKKKRDSNKDKDKNKDRNKTDDNEEQEQQAPELSFAQMEGKCYCCGKQGHKSPQCSQNNKPKSEWAINKSTTRAVLAQQQVSTPATSTTGSSSQDDLASQVPSVSDLTTSSGINWMGAQIEGASLSQARQDMKDWILLDSQSSVDLFCNPELVQDITKNKESLLLATNAGDMTTNTKAIVPAYGTVWFDKNAMTNVFSLASMEDKHRVTYDSAEESAFKVHTKNGIVKFKRGPEGLYYYKPKYRTGTSLVEVQKENESFHTPREIARAKLARNLLQSLGFPSIEDLKNAIAMNVIANCPVTTADINLAEKLFGKDIASLKAKTTRRKPTPVVSNVVEIPRELIEAQHGVDLCFDIMFVNGLPFLTTISKRILYRTAQWLTPNKPQVYRSELNAVFDIYQRAGFKVKCVHCDGEFKSIVRLLKEDHPGLESNAYNAQEHVPEAERNNRTIKERVRAAFHFIPFKALPKMLLAHLVMEAARKLNFFPAKGGISKYYSPRTIMHQRVLDYNKQCNIPLFSYVQGHDEPDPSNTLKARTLDCLYLRPLFNAQGGHELYHIPTKRIITRRKVTMIPMPQQVIDHINELGAAEGMSGLKVTNRKGEVVFDSTVLAGVDDEEGDTPETEETDETTDEREEEEQHQQEDIDPNDIGEVVHDDPSPAESNDNQDENQDDDQGDQDEPEGASQGDNTPQGGEDEDESTQRRSARQAPQPSRLTVSTFKGKSYSNAQVQQQQPFEYTKQEARCLATFICEFNDRMSSNVIGEHGSQFVVTYSLKKGIQKWGERGRQSALKEMKQLHDRECFEPIHKHQLSQSERHRALESLLFLVEKRDGTIKSRHCANGSTQRDYMSREDVSSPTVSTEATLLTAVIEAQEGRDVATLDIPNAFIQTKLEDKDGERTIMKIRGVLVDILCEMDPVYKPYVVYENGQKVLYVLLTKAIYGLLVSAMLFYRKLIKDLQEIGFKINPYDICVANRMVNGKQQTASWHVDDMKISHADPKVNDQFIEWANKKYGAFGGVKATRGKIHDYLAMTLDYRVPGQVSIGMTDYVQKMVEEYPQEDLQGPRVASPWNEHLFKVDNKSPKLPDEERELFHNKTAQGLFLCKRARPDISPAIAYFTTRVRDPSEDDKRKLTRMMKFLNQTTKDRLTLKADGSRVLKWFVDASFAVHPDMRSHTGAVMTMGQGAVQHICRKQGMNTRSSTEAEVVGADEAVGPMLWTRLFLEAQGYKVNDNILYQDNKSAMLLETNGWKSAGKRSRHLNIRYFFVADQKAKGHIDIRYCPTDKMVGDYMTKPLHGAKFRQFRQTILNLPAPSQQLSVASQLMMFSCCLATRKE